MHTWVCTLQGRRGSVVHHVVDLAILNDRRVDAEVTAIKKMQAIQPGMTWYCTAAEAR